MILGKYRLDPSMPLVLDFFVPANSRPPPGVELAPLFMLGVS